MTPKPMRHLDGCSLLALGLGLALAGGAGIGTATATAATATVRVPLQPEQADLDGGLESTRAQLYLPRTVDVLGAQLVLGYANALAVEPSRSRLTLSANGEPLAELPLIAAQGVVQAEIDVPPAVFRPGVNVLGLRAAQQHRLDCARPAFEELWTRIDPATSYLELELAPRPGSVLLSNLDSILAASFYDHEPLTVLTTRALQDDAVLEWGGLVAEGVALRRGTRPLTVRHARLAPAQGGLLWSSLRGGNVVVVGRLDELAQVLPDGLPAGARNGLVAIRSLPADPQHVAIIVTGGDEAAVRRAAEVFRAPDTVWPQSAAMAVGFPPLAATAPGPHVVEGDRTVTLAELGYASRDLPLSYTGTIELELTLPEDYYAGDGQRLVLDLNLAYGAGLAATSALIIRVNDAPWNMLRLDRSGGALMDGTRLELPMGQFAPGPNRIGFQPVLHPGDEGLCARLGDQPMFSLFDDSRIVVPPFARLTRQPDLKLFAATSFPYGAGGDHAAELHVTRPDPATVGAAWTLRGKLAQQRRAPLAGLVSSYGEPRGDRHLLIVGATADLSPEIAQAAPMPLTSVATAGTAPRVASAPSPAAPATAGAIDARAHWSRRLLATDPGGEPGVIESMTRWLVRIASAMPRSDEPDQPSLAALVGIGAGRGGGALVAFRSPWAPDRTVTVLTAENGPALAGAVARAIEPALWNRLAGDVAVWGSGEPGELTTRRVAEPYAIEPVNTSIHHLWLLWRTWMAEQPAYWLALVFATIGGLSAATGGLLRRRAAGR